MLRLELQYLLDDRCPECGAVWIQAGRQADENGKIRTHAHGGEWQFVLYGCGRRDNYVPNYQSVETEKPCRNSSIVQADKQRRTSASAALLRELPKLNLKDDELQRLEREIRFALGLWHPNEGA